jgi:hypothetical protein
MQGAQGMCHIHSTGSALKRIEAFYVAKITTYCKCSMEACEDALYIHIRERSL